MEITSIPITKTILRLYDTLNYVQGLYSEIFNAGQTKLPLEMDIDEGIPFYSNLQQIEIILDNLLANSIKFQDITKPNRYVRIVGKTDFDYLTLRISDNGIGISPEYYDRIFDVYFRLPSRISGSGIGLFVVKEIILRLRGSITVESELGYGTDFLIKIPNRKGLSDQGSFH